MKLLIFNGLLLYMLFIVTLAELEPESEPTEELQYQEYEHESRMEIQTRRKACRDLGGKCIKKNRNCPNNRPLKKPPGNPFCSKRRHCCYPELTTSDPLIQGPDCTPNGNFVKKHVCDDCSDGATALNFTSERRSGGTPIVLKNHVFFVPPAIQYEKSTYINKKGKKEDTCKIISKTVTWFCTRTEEQKWDEGTCVDKGECTGGQTADDTGHLFNETLEPASCRGVTD